MSPPLTWLVAFAITRSDRDTAIKVLLMVIFVASSIVPVLLSKAYMGHRNNGALQVFEASFASFARHHGLAHAPGTLTARCVLGDLNVTLIAHAAWTRRGERRTHGYAPEGLEGFWFHLASTGRRPREHAVTRLEVRVVSPTQAWPWPVGAMVSLIPSRPWATGHKDFAPTQLHPANPRHDALREAFAWFPITRAGVADPVGSYGGLPSLIKNFGRRRSTDYGRLPWLEVEPALADALVRTAVLVQVTAAGISVSRGVEGLDSAAYQDVLAVTQLVARHVPRWSAALEASQRGAWRDVRGPE